jgi:PAS domain S-box-containing protein
MGRATTKKRGVLMLYSEMSKAPLDELEMLKRSLDASSLVAFTDVVGNITHVNDNFCAISGYSREELIGQNHRLISSGHHDREFFRTLWRTISSGRVWRGDICNRRKDGSLYWVSSVIVPFSKEGPYRSRYVAIRHDITDRKRTEAVLAEEQTRALFSEKMASLGELAAGIGHELGNPIAAIQGRAEMLKILIKREPDQIGAHALKAAESILALTSRMEGILNSMRTLARDGAQDPFVHQAIRPILENTIEFGAERYRQREIAVSLDACDPDLSLDCRETQIIQILVNLINNACDAVQKLPERWVRVAAQVSKDSSDKIHISVTDSGGGFPETIRDRIFYPFFTTKEAGKGTGLGLNISQKLAHQHGGRIFVDATHPRTRLVLELPRRQFKPG